MAEGARDMRNRAAEQEPKKAESTEIDPAYLGDVSARMFELQAERARLEGEGASAEDLKRLDQEIAPLQAFIDEHAEDYARMEMPREITQTVRVPEKLRDKQPGLKEQLTDLQKRYDLTAEQLETETDPEARAALASGVDSLRQRIHALKADVPWEKEDRLLAKGTLKRSSAARLKARESAPAEFEAAEMDRAVLVDLRNTYSQALESGALPKAGESLIRGAVQTVDDALDRYGRGDMSADAFQSRVKDISKARKMWDRYVQDVAASEGRTQRKERERVEKEQESARAAEEASRAEKARKDEQNEEIRRRLKKVAEKQDAEKARRTTEKQSAEAQAEVEKNVAMELALAEAAKQRAEIRARIAEKMGRLKEQARERRGGDVTAALADIRNLPPPPTAEETAEARRQMGEVVEAMEAGPDTNVPENLPVAPVAETDEEFRARFRAGATTKAAEVGKGSIERVNARIDELQGKIHAEQDRLRRERNELPEGAEERFFAQGESPAEMAKRTEAIERFADEGMTPDQAVATQEMITSRSARDFENETDFTEAFTRAVEQDPGRRLDAGTAGEYATQYWNLLMKDNARLAEAMKPQPKVGFFRRLFGGGPKPKETMTPQEVIQFQKMDKMVRDIMETPSKSLRAQELRSTSGRSNTSGYIGIGRGRPR